MVKGLGMKRDPAELGPLDTAARRLERALAALESRMGAMRSSAEVGGLFDRDRSKLADELDAARGRERELEAAGQEASQALDRAIAEIRQALTARTEA